MRIAIAASLALVVGGARPALSDGVLDPSFGVGGLVTTAFPAQSGSATAYCRTGALQADGKVVAAGSAWAAASPLSYDLVLARYLHDGSLDASFGSGGRVAVDLGGDETVYDVALQADGKVVVAGGHLPLPMFLARYLPGGALDPSFGTGGIAEPALPGLVETFPAAIALDGDGRIVVAATSGSALRSMTVFRLDAGGALDATFGTAGVTTIDPSGDGTGGYSADLALQPDGKPVVLGGTYAADQQTVVLRLTAAGVPDPGFGAGGIVRTNVGAAQEDALAVALQPDGGIVAAGNALAGDRHARLVRYGPTGVPDATFGTGGIAALTLPGGSSAEAVVVQPDGKITIAGAGAVDFVLARFTAGGVLDATFGTGGVVTTNVGTSADEAYDLLIPYPGALVAIGRAGLMPSVFALARYTAATPVRLERFTVE